MLKEKLNKTISCSCRKEKQIFLISHHLDLNFLVVMPNSYVGALNLKIFSIFNVIIFYISDFLFIFVAIKVYGKNSIYHQRMMGTEKLEQCRSLVYRERRTLEDFLYESHLWEDMSGLYWKINQNEVCIHDLEMFNEVRYQCVRILLDTAPDVHLDNYLTTTIVVPYGITFTDEEEWIRYKKRMTDSRLALMRTLLCLQKPLNLILDPAVETKLLRVLPLLQAYQSQEIPEIDAYIASKKNERYMIDLLPEPESPVYLRKIKMDWADLTDGFHPLCIRKVISLWEERDEQLEMVGMIEEAYRDHVTSGSLGEKLRKSTKKFFKEVRKEIRSGAFIPVDSRIRAKRDIYVRVIGQLIQEKVRLRKRVDMLSGEVAWQDAYLQALENRDGRHRRHVCHDPVKVDTEEREEGEQENPSSSPVSP